VREVRLLVLVGCDEKGKCELIQVSDEMRMMIERKARSAGVREIKIEVKFKFSKKKS